MVIRLAANQHLDWPALAKAFQSQEHPREMEPGDASRSPRAEVDDERTCRQWMVFPGYRASRVSSAIRRWIWRRTTRFSISKCMAIW